MFVFSFFVSFLTKLEILSAAKKMSSCVLSWKATCQIGTILWNKHLRWKKFDGKSPPFYLMGCSILLTQKEQSKQFEHIKRFDLILIILYNLVFVKINECCQQKKLYNVFSLCRPNWKKNFSNLRKRYLICSTYINISIN